MMGKNNILAQLKIAVDTLERVAVEGYENRRFMLGAEQTLRGLMEELAKPEEVRVDGKPAETE